MKKTSKATFYELTQADIKEAIEKLIQNEWDDSCDYDYEVVLKVNPDDTITAVATRNNDDDD